MISNNMMGDLPPTRPPVVALNKNNCYYTPQFNWDVLSF